MNFYLCIKSEVFSSIPSKALSTKYLIRKKKSTNITYINSGLAVGSVSSLAVPDSSSAIQSMLEVKVSMAG